MQRILFWIGLILLINWWWRRNSRVLAERLRAHLNERADQAGGPFQRGAGREAQPQFRAPNHHAAPQVEPMACCAQCGTYIPVSEALSADSRHFCCAEHARQFASHAA
jgi:uncharacterized protein